MSVTRMMGWGARTLSGQREISRGTRGIRCAQFSSHSSTPPDACSTEAGVANLLPYPGWPRSCSPPSSSLDCLHN